MLLEREHRVLAAGAVVAGLILIVSFLVMPDLDKVRSLGRQRTQAEKDLLELRSLIPELGRLDAGLRGRKELVRATATGQESPLARLTARLTEAGFPQSAFSVKSAGVKDGEFFKEESFDVKIENRSYLELVQFIRKLEDGSLPVAIRSVVLKSRYESSSSIDCNIRVGYQLPR
jgi:hypothetical protein